MTTLDLTVLNFVTGADAWKYNKNSLDFIATESTNSLFCDDSEESDSGSDSEESTSVPSYDAVLQSGSFTYLFQGTNLQIVASGSNVDSVSLDNNGNSNPYKSGNHGDRPTQIIAACSIDSDRHIFLSEGTVYLFTFSTREWENLGYFVCN